MTEVTPGIHWLKIPSDLPGVTTMPRVNAYLIQGEDGYILIDVGWNTTKAFDSLQKQLAEIGVNIKDISRIVLTHVHPDHYGMAGRVKQLSGASMVMHEIDREVIEPRYIKMDQLLEQTEHCLLINGVPLDEALDLRNATVGLEQYVIPIYPDFTFRGGETITTDMFTFKVLWTPGHSPGHICLYEPEKKILISGDHILPKITPNIGLHPQSNENPLGRYIDSLNNMKKLDAELILPGHEHPFTRLRPRIDEIIQHHEQRNQEILTAVKAETQTAYRIAREIPWAEGVGWQGLPPFHKRMAIFETLAHLELMVANHQIEKISRDSIIYYQQT